MTVSCTYFGWIILIDSIVVQGNYREGIFVIEKTPVIGNLCVQYVVQYVDLPDPAGGESSPLEIHQSCSSQQACPQEKLVQQSLDYLGFFRT